MRPRVPSELRRGSVVAVHCAVPAHIRHQPDDNAGQVGAVGMGEISLRKAISVAVVVLLLAIVSGAWFLWQRSGAYGLNVLLRRGGSYWITVAADDARLSPAMRLALQSAIPQVTAGESAWKEVEAGFEANEIPVVAGSQELDRLYLIASTRPGFASLPATSRAARKTSTNGKQHFTRRAQAVRC